MHGYQHTAVNLMFTAASAGPLAWAGRPVTAAAFTAGLLFGTLLVTPDLDLQLNDARRRWGRLRFIWAPYAALSRHRGMSHTYVIGPTIRLAYLALWAAPLLVLLRAQVSAAFHDLPPGAFTVALAGYFTTQWLHLLCDGILPGQPRHRPR